MCRSRYLAQKELRIACAALAVSAATLACTLNVGGPQRPGEPIPTSEAAAQEILGAWESAAGAPDASGEVRLIMTESQLTSLVAARVAENPNSVLKDPQVYLRQGRRHGYHRDKKRQDSEKNNP